MKDRTTTDAALLAEIRQELAAAMAARPWEAEERARYGFTLAEYQAALVAEVEAELDGIRARYAKALTPAK